MSKNNRRKFLRQMLGLGCASLTLTPYLSSITNLQAMNALAVNNNSPYKALVCIMLAGGNDSFNMLIPTDSAAVDYTNQRGDIALDVNSIRLLTPSSLNTQNHYGQFGLHSGLENIADMFNNPSSPKSNVSFISNIGTLVRPTSLNDYNNSNSLPTSLFSHSDQSSHWQTSLADKRSAIGWGGRMIDLLSTNNPYAHISLDGINLFQRGNSSREYVLNPSSNMGATPIWGDNSSSTYNYKRMKTIDSLTVDSLTGANYMNILQKSYMNTLTNARENTTGINAALATSNANLNTSFENNGLQNQLKWVAKTIAVRDMLNVSRQTFYVVHTGYDTHDEMINQHEGLMQTLDNALATFDEALGELGVRNQVTTFTVSDFARTLRSNGDGTDHGWGGHVMVMGGDINGGQILGDYPLLLDGSTHKISGGRFIPTTSCDEYFADLALWFADTDNNTAPLTFAELKDILPNIDQFGYSSNNILTNRLGLFS